MTERRLVNIYQNNILKMNVGFYKPNGRFLHSSFRVNKSIDGEFQHMEIDFKRFQTMKYFEMFCTYLTLNEGYWRHNDTMPYSPININRETLSPRSDRHYYKLYDEKDNRFDRIEYMMEG